MYIEARFEYLKAGKCPLSVIVFGCERVYRSMQHLHFGQIFIMVFGHSLSA